MDFWGKKVEVYTNLVVVVVKSRVEYCRRGCGMLILSTVLDFILIFLGSDDRS